MTKENIYYFCTICGHVHLRNSEIGKLHADNSFKTVKQKKEMELTEKGMGVIDYKLEKRIADKRRKKLSKKTGGYGKSNGNRTKRGKNN